MKKILKWGLIVIIGLGVIGSLAGGDDEGQNATETVAPTTQKEEKNISQEESKESHKKVESIKQETEENTDKQIEEVSRKSEIETAVRNEFSNGDYLNVKLSKITINENLGTEASDDYIALIYLKFDVKNTRKTGNNVMRMYSDDLVAKLANQGIADISESAIFWEDEYNERDVKYAYEYKNGGFYIMDIAGE
ncbi:MAG: hypothetical protein N4A48_03940 [Tepidibacter sp.]|uniref:hypothetical protein n=1 Tax=Tepidibacter sp. TaxID=2529387 RepID=UPI0025DF1B1D|nr:hypothetical protein [Tepidibacter sp.]MCT4507900.1 hypothetical protein [Tepidibacter sp.]MCT4606875.1 hypothetical protein [Marinisporobacter sp.]